MEKSLERFLRYVKIDTQSNSESQTVPSDPKELDLSREILRELKEWGLEAHIDEFGVLYGKLPGEEGLDPIGLNAHVDTAEETSDKDVKPQII